MTIIIFEEVSYPRFVSLWNIHQGLTVEGAAFLDEYFKA